MKQGWLAWWGMFWLCCAGVMEASAEQALHVIHTSDVRGTVGICG